MARSKKSQHAFSTGILAIGALRIIVALIIVGVGGWLSLAVTISGISRYKSPDLALVFMANDSAALASRADQLLSANMANPPESAARLARIAIKNQALNAKAIRVIGYIAEARGNRAKSKKMIELAARLSRRETGAQLWLIEYYAQANDTKRTLRHYDIVLTTQPELQSVLFPRLSNGISDASIRTALLLYLRQDREWTKNFLWHAINTDRNLLNIVNLVVEAGGFPKSRDAYKSSREQEKSLLVRLVNEGYFTDATRIFLLVPNADPKRLTNPAFDSIERNGDFGAMGWRITDDSNVGGGFVAGKAKGATALSVFASSATTQTVASRLLYMPSTKYRFKTTVSHYEPGDSGYLQFQLRCAVGGTGSPVWALKVVREQNSDWFEVPPNCPVQYLEIIASGGKGQLGLEATIANVAVERQSSTN